jgi:hypothetical protein
LGQKTPITLYANIYEKSPIMIPKGFGLKTFLLIWITAFGFFFPINLPSFRIFFSTVGFMPTVLKKDAPSCHG